MTTPKAALGKIVRRRKLVLSLFTAIVLVGALPLSFNIAKKSPAPRVTSGLEQYSDAGQHVVVPRALRAKNSRAAGMNSSVPRDSLSSASAESVNLKHEVLLRESQPSSHFGARWAEACNSIWNKSMGSSDRVNYTVGKQCWGACGDAIADAILACPIGQLQSKIQSWPVMQMPFLKWGRVPPLATALSIWICLPYLIVAIVTLLFAFCMRVCSMKHIDVMPDKLQELQKKVQAAVKTSQAEGHNYIEGLAEVVPGAVNVRAGEAIRDKVEGYAYPQKITRDDFQNLADAIEELHQGGGGQPCKLVFGMKLRTAMIEYLSGGLALSLGATYCSLHIWFCIVFVATLLSASFIEDTSAILSVHDWAKPWVQGPMYIRHLSDMNHSHAPTWLKDLMILHPVTGFCNIVVGVMLTTVVLFVADKLWQLLADFRKLRAAARLTFLEEVSKDLLIHMGLLTIVIAASTLSTFLLTSVASVMLYLYQVSRHGVAWSCTKSASATMFGSANPLAPYYIGGIYNVLSLIHGLLPFPTPVQNVNKPSPSKLSAWCIRDTWMSKFDIATNGGSIFVDTNTDVSQSLLFFFRGLPFYGMATCSGIVIQMAILVTETLRGESANVSFLAVLLQSDSIVYLRASWAASIMLRDFLRKAAREAIGETYICMFVGIMALFCEPMETVLDVATLLLSTIMSAKSIKFGVAEAMELSTAEEEILVQPVSSRMEESRPFAMCLISPNDYYARQNFKEKRHIKLVAFYRTFESLGVICTIVVCFATSSAKTTWEKTYCMGLFSFLISLSWWIEGWNSATEEACCWKVIKDASIQADTSNKLSIGQAITGTVVHGRKEGDWINLIPLCGYIHKDQLTKLGTIQERQDWSELKRYKLLTDTHLKVSKDASDDDQKHIRSRYPGAILGIDEGDGWLKVGDFFLPSEVVKLSTDEKHFDGSSFSGRLWHHLQSSWETWVGVEKLNGSWTQEKIGTRGTEVIEISGNCVKFEYGEEVLHRMGRKTFWTDASAAGGASTVILWNEDDNITIEGFYDMNRTDPDQRFLQKLTFCILSVLLVVASLSASLLVIPACEILLWSGSITRPGARWGGLSFSDVSLQKSIWLMLMWTLLLSAYAVRSASPFNLPQTIDDIILSVRTQSNQVSAIVRACIIFIGFVSSVLFAIIGKELRKLHDEWEKKDQDGVDVCCTALSEAVSAVKEALGQAAELVSVEARADLNKKGREIGMRIWKGDANPLQLLAEHALNMFYGSEDRMLFDSAQVKNLRGLASILDEQDLMVLGQQPEGGLFEGWQRLIGWHLLGGGFIEQVGYREEIPKDARASILQRLMAGVSTSEQSVFVFGICRNKAAEHMRSGAEGTLRKWITSESSTTCTVSAISEDLANIANILREAADPGLPPKPLISVRDVLHRLGQNVAKVAIIPAAQCKETQPEILVPQDTYTPLSDSLHGSGDSANIRFRGSVENQIARRSLAGNVHSFAVDLQDSNPRQEDVIGSIDTEVELLRAASSRVQADLEVVQMNLPVPNKLMKAIALNNDSPANAFIAHLAQDEQLTTAVKELLATSNAMPFLQAALEPTAETSMLGANTLMAKLAKSNDLTASATKALARADLETLVGVLTEVLTPIANRNTFHDEQALKSAEVRKHEEDEHCLSMLKAILSLETSLKSRVLEQDKLMSLLAQTMDQLQNVSAQRAILQLLLEGGSVGFEELTKLTNVQLQQAGVIVRELQDLRREISTVEQGLTDVMTEKGVPRSVQILNSPHPYPADKYEHDSEITIPGAKGLQIIFSKLCLTDHFDVLTLSGIDAEGHVTTKTFSGESTNWMPLQTITIGDADKMTVHFQTQGMGESLKRQGYFAIVFPKNAEASEQFKAGEVIDAITNHFNFVKLKDLTNEAHKVVTRLKAIADFLFEVGSVWISSGKAHEGVEVLMKLARKLVDVETTGVCTFLPRQSLQILSSGADHSLALERMLTFMKSEVLQSKVPFEKRRALEVLHKCAATDAICECLNHIIVQIQEKHRNFVESSHDVAARKRAWADQPKSDFDKRVVYVHHGQPYPQHRHIFFRQVSIPSATSMSVFFAKQSCTCDGDSTLVLRKPEDENIITKFYGHDSWVMDAKVDGSQLYFDFKSDGYGPVDERWGFFALVVPDGVSIDPDRLEDLVNDEAFTNMAAKIVEVRQEQEKILQSVSNLVGEVRQVLSYFDEKDLPDMLQKGISELATTVCFDDAFPILFGHVEKFPRELQESSMKTVVDSMLQSWLDDLSATSETCIAWKVMIDECLEYIRDSMPDVFKGLLQDDGIATKVQGLGSFAPSFSQKTEEADSTDESNE